MSEDLKICAGCGTSRSIEEIRRAAPRALSCCPERKMIPIRSLWLQACALERVANEALNNPAGDALTRRDMILLAREARR